jgi:hypothetical protein
MILYLWGYWGINIFIIYTNIGCLACYRCVTGVYFLSM